MLAVCIMLPLQLYHDHGACEIQKNENEKKIKDAEMVAKGANEKRGNRVDSCGCGRPTIRIRGSMALIVATEIVFPSPLTVMVH